MTEDLLSFIVWSVYKYIGVIAVTILKCNKCTAVRDITVN